MFCFVCRICFLWAFFHQQSPGFSPSFRTPALLWGEKVPSWPIFWVAIHATSLWYPAPASLWKYASKELCELDWHSHSLTDHRTLLVNVIVNVLDVPISEKAADKWREYTCIFHCFRAFWWEPLPCLKHNVFFTFLIICVDEWENGVSFSRPSSILVIVFSVSVTNHIPRMKAQHTDRRLILTDIALKTLHFYEFTAKLFSLGLPCGSSLFPIIKMLLLSKHPNILHRSTE